MALYVNPAAQIVAAVNAANTATIKNVDVYFRDTGPNTAVDGDPLYGKNAVTTIVAVDGMDYTGSATIAYDRLNLAVVFANHLLEIDIYNPTTIHNALADINRRLATTFTADDLEDGPLTTVGLPATLTLTAKPGSLGWTGTVSFTYTADGPAPLVIPDVHLDGVLAPSGQVAVAQASLYSWDYDYSAYSTLVLAQFASAETTPITLSESQLSQVATMLATVTGHAWTTAVGPYSIAGAVCVYYGSASSQLLNGNFNKVAVFELTASCTNMAGKLYCYFL